LRSVRSLCPYAVLLAMNLFLLWADRARLAPLVLRPEPRRTVK
jgi:hypothetical protein